MKVLRQGQNEIHQARLIRAEKEAPLIKKIIILVLFVIASSVVWILFFPREQASGLTARPNQVEADACSRKLAQLAAPSAKRGLSPVEFRQSEIDAYVQQELSPLFPKGIEQVQIALEQGLISGSSRINFDRLEASDGKRNLLLAALLRGEHTLGIVASLKTQNRMGSYEVSKILLDDREVPKPLVDLLIEKYVVAKYPAAKPNTPFPLPYNIERIDILPGRLVAHPAGN